MDGTSSFNSHREPHLKNTEKQGFEDDISTKFTRQQCDKFLRDYEQNRPRYEMLVRVAREVLEELLESVGIKGIVQGRTKKLASLGEKLKGLSLEAEFQEWVCNNEKVVNYYEMGDLAGIRIGLFFPSDIVKIDDELRKHFKVIHPYGTVPSGREASQNDRLEIKNHSKGPWRDPIGDDWENYGYKSWQMVLEWEKSPIEQLESPRMEIQVGTVVTQAWAEIQHNIIYKRPKDIPSTPSMKRMIDGINGLAITTDIMLKELERSLEVAIKECKQRGYKPFTNHNHLFQWFKTTYLSRMTPEERKLWACNRVTASRLIDLCSGKPIPLAQWGQPAKSGEEYKGPPACPIVFSNLIEKYGLLQKRHLRPKKAFDICVLLLEVMGKKDFVPDEYMSYMLFSHPRRAPIPMEEIETE